MILKLILLIVGVAIVQYFWTGRGKIGRAQEDEKTPVTRPIGVLVGCIIGISGALLLAKDALGPMVYITKVVNWIDQIITQLITTGLL